MEIPEEDALSSWTGRITDALCDARWHLGTLHPSARGGDAAAPVRMILFPAGDANVASSRLRALPLLSLMVPSTITSGRRTSGALQHSPEIVWFQKRITSAHLRAARVMKERGALLVYDCDESGPDLDAWARRERVIAMLRLADLVTTDTPERRDQLRELVPSCAPQVIENQIDHLDRLHGPPRPSALGGEDTIRVLWFGYGENLRLLAPWVEAILSLRGARLVLCGPSRSIVRRTLGRVTVELHPWSRADFLDVLRGCHVTLLSHLGSRFDQAKSAHKMITSICHGVPALVSATPDHERVAAFAGIADTAVFRTPEEVRERLERMRSGEARRTLVERAAGRLLDRYGHGHFSAEATRLLRCVPTLQDRLEDPPRSN